MVADLRIINPEEKKGNLALPAKEKAPVSLTSTERTKLTLQNYRLENKDLESKIVQMQKEIKTQSFPINNNLEKIPISIIGTIRCDQYYVV